MKPTPHLLLLCLLCIPKSIYSEPISTTATVLTGAGYIVGVGIIFYGCDKLYKHHSKSKLKSILTEFHQCKIQTRETLQKKSTDSIWYAKSSGPNTKTKTDLYIEMNTSPIPSSYEELVRFMAAHNFDQIRQRIITTLRLYPQSEALGSWYGFQRMMIHQKDLIEDSADNS